jgi:hypothetical protein
MRVEQGLDAYLAENGFTRAEYDSKWTHASFLGVRFRIPNTPAHRRAIMLHDLHHVATGYGTDLAGEGEISAWELRRGLRGLGLYVGSIVAMGTLAGLLFETRRTVRAWRCSPRGPSLFQDRRPYDEYGGLTIGELRSELKVPEQGLATRERQLHAYAPRA